MPTVPDLAVVERFASYLPALSGRLPRRLFVAMLVVLAATTLAPGAAAAQTTIPIDTEGHPCDWIGDHAPVVSDVDVCTFGTPPGMAGSGPGPGVAGTVKSAVQSAINVLA